MTKNREDDIAKQLQPLIDDDAFLTELSVGNDPADGKDDLANLFLELRSEINRQMPPAPVIEGADEKPNVISLPRARRRSRPMLHGLIGAAAATVLIAGAGTAIYNAGPSSPLYDLNQTVFGDDDTVVELAGKLDEMESRAASGDYEGARALIDEARKLIEEANADQPKEATSPRQAPSTVTQTVTSTETTTRVATPEEEPTPEIATTTVVNPVTETAVSTVTSTVTVTDDVPLNPLPAPTQTQTPVEPTAETTAPLAPLAPPQVQQ